MKLALGTVQFGLRYGAFNSQGQVSEAEAKAILEVARAGGIGTLDTARGYGDSEAVLGRLRAADQFRIITKIASLAGCSDAEAEIDDGISQSCERLGTGHLDTVLFHDCNDLLGPDADKHWAIAKRAQMAGLIGKLGVSVYNPDQAEEVAARYPMSVIQIPVSIFDQRAIAGDALRRLKAKGIEIHARSAFLQGFALADPETLTGSLARHADKLRTFRAFAAENGITPLSAALNFVIAAKDIDRVVVGVLSAKELTELIAIASTPQVLQDATRIASHDAHLLNPALWQAN